jgi:DNA gyrase/topoisomerase IV subunit A
VIRTRAGEVKLSGRQTMGVRLMNLGPGDSVVALARNAESLDPETAAEAGTDEAAPEAGTDETAVGAAAEGAVAETVTEDNETAAGDVS